MQGYIQELDTVRFDYDQVAGNFLGKFNNAKVSTVLYSIFYDICLSPNQVIDLLPLREHLYDEKGGLSLPFIYHLDSDINLRNQPFTNQLVKLLRREGNDAFIFSSTPNGRQKCIEWGAFMVENRGINDDDLIKEAHSYYSDVIDWVEKLDSHKNKLRMQSFSLKCSYKDLLDNYIRKQFGLIDYISFDAPTTRSMSYQAILNTNLSAKEVSEKKTLPDFVSNLQYAIGTNSKLIVDQMSNLFIDDNLSEYPISSITIDIKGLISAYPELESRIISLSMSDISTARFKTRDKISEGWDYLSSGNKEMARLSFSDGLRLFIKDILQREIKVKDLLDINANMSPKGVGFSLPIGKFIKWIIQEKQLQFKGISKFLNIK